VLPPTVRAGHRQDRRAFTLIELLVVIAIILPVVGEIEIPPQPDPTATPYGAGRTS
jgi:prepilin-type N-terminal cleavage/methylation domain-containing protein